MGAFSSSPTLFVRKVIFFNASTKSELALVRSKVSDAFMVESVETVAWSWAVAVAKFAIASAVS